MFIKADKDLLTYIGARRIRIDEMFTLVCYAQNRLDLLKVFLNGRTGDQCTVFMQAMERKGLMRKLSPDAENFDWDNYTVTEEGNEVYEDCIMYFTETMDAPPQVAQVAPIVVPTGDAEIVDISIAFINLWPEGVKNQAGDRIKSHLSDVVTKMKKFVTKYGFDKDTILAATQRYLDRQRPQGYAYCNQAIYFILKDNVSKLASECMNTNEPSTDTWDTIMT